VLEDIKVYRSVYTCIRAACGVMVAGQPIMTGCFGFVSLFEVSIPETLGIGSGIRPSIC